MSIMKKPEAEYQLKLQPRSQETISLKIPNDILESLNKVARSRDMSFEALLKFYIGQGLGQDLARLFSNRVLEVTAQVLEKHIHSKEQLSAIVEESREETQ